MAEENPFARLFTARPTSLVRLAVLQPGLGEAPLEITLTSAEPSDTTYSCISYDRSQNYGTTEISVDNQPLAIAKPLESALRAVRKPKQPCTLWADLLIGNNVEERSKMNIYMKSVLENAEETIIWLGPGDENTGTAFGTLKHMASRWQQAARHCAFPKSLSLATPKQMADLREHLQPKSVDEFQFSNKALWKTIEETITSRYFASTQAITDIVLARNVLIASGGGRISWSDFVSAGRAAPFIMSQQPGMTVSEDQLNSFTLVNSLELAERRRREGETLELLPMIQSSRDCSNNDPREIVFSMLPIVTPSKRTADSEVTQSLPKADYSRSTQDVFSEAARYIVHERQDLLLWWTERPPCGQRIQQLPSWVPDWSTPQPKRAVKITPGSSNGMRSWWENIAPGPKRITVSDSNELHVQAHALDRVVSISPIFTEHNCRRLCLSEWQALPTQPRESLDDKIQKMFRTLILNQAGTGNTIREDAPPPREMWISFQSILAEERLLELLGCTMEQLMTSPEIVERMKALPDAMILGPQTGKSEAFEVFLRNNAIGRRFFCTESGRTGMTAIEARPPDADPAAEEPAPPPNFDSIMADPIGRSMLSSFQQFVAKDNPHAAGLLFQAMQGTLPKQSTAGVMVGDLVVALVGGFQPYVLRPVGEHAVHVDGAEQLLDAVSSYTYVGDCYLHGVMAGEPFKTRRWWGQESWAEAVKLVDVTIV